MNRYFAVTYKLNNITSKFSPKKVKIIFHPIPDVIENYTKKVKAFLSVDNFDRDQ